MLGDKGKKKETGGERDTGVINTLKWPAPRDATPCSPGDALGQPLSPCSDFDTPLGRDSSLTQ